MDPGVWLVHKRAGETSFQHVLAALGPRGRGVCHAGALDPFAHGLLILLAGQATRLIELMHPIPKEYAAEIAWGAETDNGDPLGKVVAQGDASRLTAAAIDEALPAFLGWREQIPPAASNKKIGGEPAYKKFHRGEIVELPPSRVYLHSARWLAHDLPRSSRLELVCRGGYYVRALARDLGRMLGARAHLATLHRTAIGPWRDPERPEHVTGRGIVPWCRARVLGEAEKNAVAQGKPIERGTIEPPDWPLPPGWPDPQAPLRALHGDKLVALLREEADALRPFANLRGGL